MKRIKNTIKNIRLSLNYGSIFTINSIIIILELTVVFVLSNIMLNILRQDNASKLEMKEYVANNIVIYDTEKENQSEYCIKNGTLLGYNINFNFYKDKTGVSYNSNLYTKDYLNVINFPLQKGKWFSELKINEINNYDFIAVVPYQYRKDFKVGKVYHLYLKTSDSPSMYKVYISGVLKPYVSYTYGDSFICYDVNSILFKEELYNDTARYCQLDYFNKKELSSLGIKSFDEEYKRMIEETKSDRGFTIILIITLYTIFLCGFIGDRILNVDIYTKTYATMFLCGATKRKAMIVQLMQSISTLLISSSISFFIIKYLYSVQFTYLFFHFSAFIGTILITLIIHFLISLLILIIISKMSPVSIISGRYN